MSVISPKNIFPGVKIVNEENRGLAETRNNGFRIAAGTYAMFCDADDTLDPTYIEKCVKLLEADPTLGSAYSWTRAFGDCTQTWPTADLDMRVLRDRNQAPSHSVVRKIAWEDIVKINGVGSVAKYQTYFEDHLQWIDLVRAGWRGKCIPEPLIRHREHATNMMKNPERAANLARMMQELRKDRPDIYTNIHTAPCTAPSAPAAAAAVLSNKNILVMMPGLTCGGSEQCTLDTVVGLHAAGYAVHMLTTCHAAHVWEHRFKPVTASITHMPMSSATAADKARVLAHIRSKGIGQVFGVHSLAFYECMEYVATAEPGVRILHIFHQNPGMGYHHDAVKFNKYISKHVVLMQASADWLIKAGVGAFKVAVIPNGIDVCRFHDTPKLPIGPLRGLNVLYLGRLGVEKRPLDFIELAARLPSANFTIAGDGPLRAHVAQTIAARRLPNLTATGLVSPEECLRKADVLVLSSDIEVMPLVCLEALASGCFVIATDVGAVRSMLTNPKWCQIVRVGDIEAMRATLARLQANMELLADVRANGRAWVAAHYNITTMRTRYCEAFGGTNVAK